MRRLDLLLMRHGDVAAQGRLLGRSDPPLSPLGLRQVELLKLPNSIDAICCSPARRCAAYAHRLAVQRGLPLIEQDQLWEFDFGDWEGLELNSLSADHALWRFWQDPFAVIPPAGETYTGFRQRVINAVLELTRCEHQTILLVVHAGVIREILAWAIGQTSPATMFSIDYASVCSVSVFIDEPLAFRINYINRINNIA